MIRAGCANTINTSYDLTEVRVHYAYTEMLGSGQRRPKGDLSVFLVVLVVARGGSGYYSCNRW